MNLSNNVTYADAYYFHEQILVQDITCVLAYCYLKNKIRVRCKFFIENIESHS